LNRLLLLCRFDFRQRNWSLPAWEIPRDANAVFPAHSAALAAAIYQNLSDFPDPSLNGASSSKSAARRSLEKSKPSKERKHQI
jgi:hypothetical protein